MKDFIEKPITAEVRELVLRIVERAMFYNNTRTEKELTGDKPTFMVHFSGHTATLSVYIFYHGWSGENDESECYTLHLSERGYSTINEATEGKLNVVLERMEKVYTEWYEKEHCNV